MNRSRLYYLLIPILFAAWLWSVLVSRLLTLQAAEGGDKLTMFLALCWPFVVVAFVEPLRNAFAVRNIVRNAALFVFLLVFVGVNAISILASESPSSSAGYFASLVAGIVLAYVFNTAMDDEQLRRGLVAFTLMGTALLGLISVTWDVSQYVRLGGLVNPNVFGIMCAGVILCALQWRKWQLGLLVILPTLVMLFLTNSRSAMSALLIGVVLWLMFRARWIAGIGTVTYFACLLALGVLVLYFTQERLKEVLIFISNVYALEDPARGLGTGASGRWDAWKEAWRLFESYPWFGVGWKMHEHYMTTAASAHSGYLGLLAETGMMGTVVVAYFVMRALRRTAARVSRPTEGWSAAYLVSWLFIAGFETLLLTIATPWTTLALVLLVRGFMMQPAGSGRGWRRASPSEDFWAGVARPAPVPAPVPTAGGESSGVSPVVEEAKEPPPAQ
ncbi:MAG: O-antigen ligase family protein [Planctomycetes bacterium]|nr:O-antigen ligase family protein [Planctomycetota bacterium]